MSTTTTTTLNTPKAVTKPLGINDRTPSQVRKQFDKIKKQRATELFKLYNKTIFQNKLPSNIIIEWNSRLLSTAGRAKLSHKISTVGGQTSVSEFLVTKIELSSKVVDSDLRLCSTLCHEMCHAATWIINKGIRGHGKTFNDWQNKAKALYPQIETGSCHKYEIAYKFKYKCLRCQTVAGKWTKIKNEKEHKCQVCKTTGNTKLIQRGSNQVFLPDQSPPSSQQKQDRLPPSQTPKTKATPPFARYTRTHFTQIHQNNPGKTHAEIMKLLSAQYQLSKIK